jgi:uncharacterized membrane protein YgcG
MEAARTSETLVNFYQTTRRYNPEDSHLHTHRRENLKSYLPFATSVNIITINMSWPLLELSLFAPKYLIIIVTSRTSKMLLQESGEGFKCITTNFGLRRFEQRSRHGKVNSFGGLSRTRNIIQSKGYINQCRHIPHFIV